MYLTFSLIYLVFALSGPSHLSRRFVATEFVRLRCVGRGEIPMRSAAFSKLSSDSLPMSLLP
jgi:hypothetical protein